MLKFATKGYETAEKELSSEAAAEPVLKYLKATHELSHAQNAETAARLIEMNDLCLEHIPTKLLKTKEVSKVTFNLLNFIFSNFA